MPKILQVILAVALALAFAGGAYFYTVMPLSEKSELLKAQFLHLRAENDRNEVFLRNHAEYLIRFRELREKNRELRAIVPYEPDTHRLERTVREMGRAAGVRVRSFAAGRPVSHDFYAELPLTVEFGGSYLSVLNFLTRLGQTPRIVSVSDFSLGPPAGRVSPDFSIRPNELVAATCVVSSYHMGRSPAPLTWRQTK